MNPQIITTVTDAGTTGLKAVSDAGPNNSILFAFLMLVGTITFLLWKQIKENGKQTVEMTKMNATLIDLKDDMRDIKSNINAYINICNRKDK